MAVDANSLYYNPSSHFNTAWRSPQPGVATAVPPICGRDRDSVPNLSAKPFQSRSPCLQFRVISPVPGNEGLALWANSASTRKNGAEALSSWRDIVLLPCCVAKTIGSELDAGTATGLKMRPSSFTATQREAKGSTPPR